MRTTTSLLGASLLVALACVMPAAAQQQAASFFTGANPRNIQFKTIDVTRSMKTLNVQNAFHKPAAPKAFSMANIFPRVHMGTWPPVRPNTPILDKKNNPYQPNPIFGKNLFDPAPKK